MPQLQRNAGLMRLCTPIPISRLQVTTFGKNGSILLDRDSVAANSSATPQQEATLDSVIDRLFADVRTRPQPDRSEAAPCTSQTGTPIYPGHHKVTDGAVMLQFDRRGSKERAKLQAALLASSKEAGMGAAAPAMYNSSYAQQVHDGDDAGEHNDGQIAAGSSHRQMAVQVCMASYCNLHSKLAAHVKQVSQKV